MLSMLLMLSMLGQRPHSLPAQSLANIAASHTGTPGTMRRRASALTACPGYNPASTPDTNQL